VTILNYEELVRQFENALLTQLRGHNNDAGFLEMWVPDPDPVKSMLNMVESAELAGLSEFEIRIGQTTIDKAALDSLAYELDGMATFECRVDSPSQWRLVFNLIGGRS
jgi:hypothetical protein